MRTVNTNELHIGMITAEDILSETGQQIIDKGTVLTKRLIMRLTFYKIPSITVEDEQVEGQVLTAPETKTVNVTYSQKLKSSQEFQSFQIDHSLLLATIKDNLEGFVKNGTPIDTSTLLEQTVKLYDSCSTSLELFDMLHNMRSSNDTVYNHSLNVALISRRLGRWLKLDEATQDTITLAGLLHDIGKLRIPDEILNKPGKYTDEEFELIKNHPKMGYDLIEPLALDGRIKKAALAHHERCDGSGYPMGLSQEYTDDCALLIAIADVYDAMTAARPHRPPLCPFQVISNFEQDGLQKYKPKYILTFLQHMASMYQNNRVLLSDGRSANIVMLNQNCLSKPIIQFDDSSCLDLSMQTELSIQAVL